MKKKYYISICLLAKNENNYINEWLKWHIDLGVEHFYIYDNDSDIPLINNIYKDYFSLPTYKGKKYGFIPSFEKTELGIEYDKLEFELKCWLECELE